MSYEGYTEYLTRSGKYLVVDCYEPDPETSPDDPIVWRHSVDQTNGIEEGNPDTYPAEKEEIGFKDIWKKDHYGNPFAVKLLLYAPKGKEWKPVNGQQ
jgi:hypothetical protein